MLSVQKGEIFFCYLTFGGLDHVHFTLFNEFFGIRDIILPLFAFIPLLHDDYLRPISTFLNWDVFILFSNFIHPSIKLFICNVTGVIITIEFSFIRRFNSRIILFGISYRAGFRNESHVFLFNLLLDSWRNDTVICVCKVSFSFLILIDIPSLLLLVN
jgi:hypothetical protein